MQGDLPKGAPHGACGCVAPLGNASSIPRGERALPQTPWDALKRQNTRDATLVTYAVRGVYWATLESCDVPDRVKGLAIGMISLIGYAPDIYLPLIRSALVDRLPGQSGYSVYFLGVAAFGLVGTVAARRLARLAHIRQRAGTGPSPTVRPKQTPGHPPGG